MSATLTWFHSGNGAKTGTAVANYFDDLDTLVNSKSGDANFSWEEAGKNSAATPYWYLLRRKDASAGRIAIICWTSAPAANNVAILDQTPTNNQLYIAWFPAGTANTLSNLTAASGTIAGDDTGCVKVSPGNLVTTAYGANIVHYYFDSYELMVFATQNPASTTIHSFIGAGDGIIDAADDVYGCTFGIASSSANQFGASLTSIFPFTVAAQTAGAAAAMFRTNYGSSNRVYYDALVPAGTWAGVAVSATDILTDTSNNFVWFVPRQLLGVTKGEGFVLKLRQIGYGPGTTGPFTPYNTTGPVVQARQFTNQTTGSVGCAWFVNFKI